MKPEGIRDKGTVLLMVLVLVGMVIVFLVSGVLLSGRQYNATVEQEEEERAFHAAEAGIHYTLYLLNSPFSAEDEFSLLDKGFWPQQMVQHQDTEDVLGTYDLVFDPLPDEPVDSGKGLSVYSLGQDDRRARCQLLRAEIRRHNRLQAVYRVAAWDHQSGCNLP